nr:ABC transporter ATP-binding protein [Cellulomonas sp. APG4]
MLDVGLELEEGEHVLCSGASGGGKSTLLNTLSGVVPQSVHARVTGQVRVRGHDPRTEPVARLALEVGRLGQDPASNTCLPVVLDEVALPLENRGVPAAEIGPRVRRALADVDAEHLAHRRVSTLSGGEQQRVALAAVLVADPAVLLLDEPTSMLDPVAAARVLRLLGRHGRGRTTLLVGHGLDAGLAAAGWSPDRVLELDGSGGLRTALPGRTAPPVRTRRGSGPVALRLRGASFSQHGRTVVSGVDLDLRAGEVTVLLGPNGSGKSSLLLGLSGLLRGSTPEGAGDVAMVFQRPEHQLLRRSVVAEVGGRTDLLDRTDLAEHAHADPFRLSGGQQRRLSVAAMVALGRRVLALDEPTAGLDAVQVVRLVELLDGLAAEGTAVVMATHDLTLAAAVADRVVVLSQGRVVADGGVDLLDPDLLAQVGLREPAAPSAAVTS